MVCKDIIPVLNLYQMGVVVLRVQILVLVGGRVNQQVLIGGEMRVEVEL
jgi:hypothetical protein